MRTFITATMVALLMLASSAVQAQQYNAALAEELGADDYGMRLYVLAFLETGDASALSQDERVALQRGHMATITELANEGHLVLAGPFVNDGELRGLYLFKTSDIDEAEALAARDPAIEKGVFKLRMTQWYGSAALLTIPETHAQIQKQQP